MCQELETAIHIRFEEIVTLAKIPIKNVMSTPGGMVKFQGFGMTYLVSAQDIRKFNANPFEVVSLDHIAGWDKLMLSNDGKA
ncbi:hypothetical protein [Thalassospira xiamenensis]|uniref:hypothetical protein n=1 Tax=Thalassospira xiamenensis TaxID=220697 RepID=UPI000DEE0801|nr:hypothetical protein [Thalassospira xiamenensis]RCK34595.1 hypothetical protein TH24_20595 [Thalassospira xiamenensis]